MKALKDKSISRERIENLKMRGFKELMKSPEFVCLSIALEELIKNNMVFESINLCLAAIDKIETFRASCEDDEDLTAAY